MEDKLRELQKIIVEWAKANSEVHMEEIRIDHDNFSVDVWNPNKITGSFKDTYTFSNLPLYKD